MSASLNEGDSASLTADMRVAEGPARDNGWRRLSKSVVISRGEAWRHTLPSAMRVPCFTARWIGLDVRSLAVFRVALALALLCDQLVHFFDTPVFLSDNGFLPRGTIHEHLQTGDFWRWSAYFMNGSTGWAWALMWVHLGSLAMLLVGWHAQAAAAVGFIMHVSQFNRSEITRHAFDYLGGGLLFWSVSLPTSATFSVDAVRLRLEPLRARGSGTAWLGGKSRPAAERRLVLSVGTFALWLQVWVTYFCAMSAKTDRAWTRDHTALQLSLQMGYLIRPWAIWMLHHEPLCRLLTALAIPIEYVLPVMLLLPSPPFAHVGQLMMLRGVAILGLVGFHAGIAATMGIGIIPWLNMAAVLGFIPTSAWDALDQLRDTKDRPAPTHVTLPRYAPVATPLLACALEAGSLLRNDGGVALSVGGATGEEEDAAETADAADDSHSLLGEPRPRDIEMAEAPATTGGWGGEAAAPSYAAEPCVDAATRCRLPAPAARRALGLDSPLALVRLAWRGFVLWTALLVVWWNLHTVDYVRPPSEHTRWPLQLLNMHQSFKVFAPRPPTEDFYVVIPGTLTDGATVDLLPALLNAPGWGFLPGMGHFDSTVPINWTQPENFLEKLRSDRWAKYLENLSRGWGTNKALQGRIEAQRLMFGRWVCRSWNSDHDAAGKRQLAKWSLTFIVTDNKVILKPSERTVYKPMKQNATVWYHSCF